MTALGRGIWREFVSRGVFPLQERLKGHDSQARLRALERSQWWDGDRLAAYRLDKLTTFLSAAGRQVPYYRELFRRVGFDPLAISDIAELARLPMLDKATIRSHTDALRADGAAGLKPFSTGGSTGEPLTFYLTPERVSHDVAAKWRATRWWDVDIGDPEIVLWGSPIEVGGQDRLKAIRDFVLRSQLLPAFQMSDDDMDRYLGRIRRARPRMLFGYPSALALLAQHARDRAIMMDGLGVHVAFVTGERLEPGDRELIESVFGCRVANGYGGRDAGFIAHECPKGSMHLSAEDIIVETVDESGQPTAPGAPGELVVTHTCTSGFPFIRYRTGDVGMLGRVQCPCGRGLPILEEVQGRATDFVVASDGTRMHGLALIYVVRELGGIKRFRIVQESLQKTRIEVVPEGVLEPDTRDRIVKGIRERLGEAVEAEVEEVTEIPPERSGKYRYVVSHVR